METFRITAVPSTGSCTLVLSGEADMSAAPDIIELGVASLDSPGTVTLVIDVAAVTFIDSTVIGAFVQLLNFAHAGGKRVVLANVPPRVQRVLDLTGLDRVFDTAVG